MITVGYKNLTNDFFKNSFFSSSWELVKILGEKWPKTFIVRSFKAWRKGHKKCVTKSGRTFKGRRCARAVSKEFRRMEADLYNLVPAIGEINAIRSNYTMGILEKDTLPLFGHCLTKVKNNIIEPRKEIRGFIARTYKYMNAAYPKYRIISRKNKKLFDSWDRLYPPTREELIRSQKIQRLQKNKNRFVLEWDDPKVRKL